MANLITFGDTFSSPLWIKDAGMPVADDAYADPLGSTKADLIKKTVANTGLIYQVSSTLFQPNTTYTISVYIERHPTRNSNYRAIYLNDTSRLWEVTGGSYWSWASTPTWKREWFTFTTPATLGAQQAVGIQIAAAADPDKEHPLFGFQLDELSDPGVNGENIPPYEFYAGLISLFPDFQEKTDAERFLLGPFPNIIGGDGNGYDAINGNGISCSGSIGIVDAYGVPLFSHDDATVTCHFTQDPWGNWSGARFKKNNESAAGVRVDRKTPLLPGMPYVISCYVKNDSISGAPYQIKINATSDAADNILSLDLSQLQAGNAAVANVSFAGNEVPYEFEYGAESYYGTYVPVGFSDPNDESMGITDRVFIYSEMPATAEGLGKAFFFRTWFRRQLEEDHDHTIYPAIQYYHQVNGWTFLRYNSTGVPKAPLVDWQLYSFTGGNIPLEADLAYPFRVGFMVAGNLELSNQRIHQNTLIEGEFITVRSSDGWKRLEIPFDASTDMGKTSSANYILGLAEPLIITSAPIQFTIRVIASAASNTTTFITGLQLNEGFAPLDWQCEFCPIIFSPDVSSQDIEIIPQKVVYKQKITLTPTVSKVRRKVAEPRLGINLGFLLFYAADAITLNLMKQSRCGLSILDKRLNANGQYEQYERQSWYVTDQSNFNIQTELFLDSDGYPFEIPEGTVMTALIGRTTPLPWVISQVEMPSYFSGRYVLKWDGEGDVKLGDFLGQLRPGPYSFTLVSRQPNRLVYYIDCTRAIDEVVGSEDFNYNLRSGFCVQISETNSANHVRNIVFVEERYEELLASGKHLYPEYLEKHYDFGTIRFMHFQDINNTFHEGAEDMPELSHATWTSRGIPVELALEFCNEVGANLWFNVPTSAKDDYVAVLARKVRLGLDNDLKVYLEFSNEFWNGSFHHGAYLQKYCENLGYTHEDAINPQWEKVKHGYAIRYTEVAQIFQDEFSSSRGFRLPVRPYEENKSRCIRVLEGIRGSLSTTASLWDYAARHVARNVIPADAVSPAAYYGNVIGTDAYPVASLGDITGYAYVDLYNGFLIPGSIEQQQYEYIISLGSTVALYEGGQHLAQGNNPDATYLFMEWVDTQDAYDLMKLQFDWFFSKTRPDSDDVYCFFENALPRGQSGSFGAANIISTHNLYDYYDKYGRTPLFKFYSKVPLLPLVKVGGSLLKRDVYQTPVIGTDPRSLNGAFRALYWDYYEGIKKV